MFASVMPHPVIPEGSELSGPARFWHQVGPGSRRRRARARADAERLAALRYRWQDACQHAGLGMMVYTPSGVVASVPRIARADFGPPVSFTVQLRPGQSAADLWSAERRLSRALHVDRLDIIDRPAPWAIVVVTGPDSAVGCGVIDPLDWIPSDEPEPPALRVA